MGKFDLEDLVRIWDDFLADKVKTTIREEVANALDKPLTDKVKAIVSAELEAREDKALKKWGLWLTAACAVCTILSSAITVFLTKAIG